MKKIFIILLIPVLLWACTDNEPSTQIPVNPEQTKSVYIKINAGKNSHRSDEPTATATSAPLYTAIIYFVDGSPDPVVYAVNTVGAQNADITLAELEAGYQFEDIPSTVSQVYVVGNYNSTDENSTSAAFPLNTGTRLSQIQDVVLNIQQVAYGELADGTTTDSIITVMDGIADVLDYDTNSGAWNGTNIPASGDLFAEVEVTPINSRIEIVQLSYSGLLTSFDIEGIYINNYYADMPLSLDTTGFSVTNNGSDTTLYDVNNAAFAYDDYSTLYDIVNSSQTPAGTATITPVNGTWAYHVFGNSSPVPHIVIKLQNVTLADGTNLGDRYLTVTGFENSGGQPITELTRNTIYKINSLAFTDEDLTILPETQTIDIWVHVTVLNWETELVTPIL